MAKLTARQQYRLETAKDVLYEDQTPLLVRNVRDILEQEERMTDEEYEELRDSM